MPIMLQNDLSSIEAKIKRIESDLQRNHKTINLIKDTVRDIANGDTQSLTRLQKALAAQGSELFLPGEPKGRGGSAGGVVRTAFNVSGGAKMAVSIPKDMCALAERATSSADIQMQEVFKILPFDNPDGGVWKQGYPITYDESSFAKQPLQVFVVPHSHDDPGWIKTFERYYTDQTRHILNNMVDKLEAFPDLKFVYAEMSFFSRWWGEITEEKRQRTKKLLESRRLEIVTGGWVMTDEANAHYFAMIDQLIEGNQWLLNQAGVKPVSGWAIDPFGHTPTMAYILKRAGFDNMLIQRTHYAVKKYLAKKKQLEFRWRQLWDKEGSTDMLCHMMPFYSYDVPHTCGPNPEVCCQFDFKRLPGGRINCPWKISPVVIGPHNVEDRARMILDQWKKKSTLYQNNIVLAPLGDDFRYDKPAEWDQQYVNYKKLFNYMNSRADWNVQAQFGTLSDYFDALRKHSGVKPGMPPLNYPSLSGDFFSYADRDDHYWSGYYTSRPFYKRLDRVLEYHLRGAEIAYSLARAHVHHHSVTSLPTSDMMKQLVSARRGLGLFQHHDGITGTAKDAVVVDYGIKMLRAILDLKDVTRQAASFLLTMNKAGYTHRDANPFIDIDEMRASHDSLPMRTVMSLTKDPRLVVLYNSLGHTRHTVVRLHTDSPWVELRGPDGAVIPTQVLPVWTGAEMMSERSYQVVFVATVPALGFSRYLIRQTEKDGNKLNVLSTLSYYNGGPKEGPSETAPFQVETLQSGQDFSIENSEIRADFSRYGAMLNALTLKASNTKIDVKVQFMMYGTRNNRERSGAYLFLPGGEAIPLPKEENPIVRIHRGPVMSEVTIFIRHVQHVVTLCNSPGIDSLAVDITNLVDIRHEVNYELIMRVNTAIQNTDKAFYTDLNGFQMLRRQTFGKLPLQGNFYPMPTAAYLQDSTHRFTILSGQSLGVASLEQGQLEIVQDRSLAQDDNRGLGQGVTDNKCTPNVFRFLLEKRAVQKVPILEPGMPAGFLSVMGTLSSRELLHPVMVMPATSAPNPPASSELLVLHSPLSADLPCELHLLNLRTLQRPEVLQFLPQDNAGLLLHHTAFDCTLPSKGVSCSVGNGMVTLSTIFRDIVMKEALSTSLTLIHDGSSVDTTKPTTVPPMEIKAFKVKLG